MWKSFLETSIHVYDLPITQSTMRCYDRNATFHNHLSSITHRDVVIHHPTPLPEVIHNYHHTPPITHQEDLQFATSIHHAGALLHALLRYRVCNYRYNHNKNASHYVPVMDQELSSKLELNHTLSQETNIWQKLWWNQSEDELVDTSNIC